MGSPDGAPQVYSTYWEGLDGVTGWQAASIVNNRKYLVGSPDGAPQVVQIIRRIGWCHRAASRKYCKQWEGLDGFTGRQVASTVKYWEGLDGVTGWQAAGTVIHRKDWMGSPGGTPQVL